MNKVIFDFDGTIININDLHISAWNKLLFALKLPDDIGVYFSRADTATISGRYDSYERIRSGLMRENRVIDFLSSRNIDINDAPRRLMDMKEAYLLRLIEDCRATFLLGKTSTKCDSAIDMLLGKNYQLHIVSSSREMVIVSVLKKIGILDAFEGIYGEESMTDPDGVLHDKPDPYVGVQYELSGRNSIYIGDNGVIDSQFATNIGAQFARYYWGSNMHTTVQGAIDV